MSLPALRPPTHERCSCRTCYSRLGQLLLLPLLIALGGCVFAITSDGRISPLSSLDVLADEAGGCAAEGDPADAIRQQMFDQLNAYRVLNGLPALRYSKNLEAAASAHAQDMHDRNFVDHVNPDGQTPFDRAQAHGFCAASVSENIAVISSDDPLQAQLGWQSSPGHDANMRSRMWNYVGMGHFRAPDSPGVGGLTADQLANFLLDPNAEIQPAEGASQAGASYWVQP